MKKFLNIAVSAFITSFLLVGCGDSDNQPTTSEAPVTESATSSSNELQSVEDDGETILEDVSNAISDSVEAVSDFLFDDNSESSASETYSSPR